LQERSVQRDGPEIITGYAYKIVGQIDINHAAGVFPGSVFKLVTL
jgi:hypothetical protein